MLRAEYRKSHHQDMVRLDVERLLSLSKALESTDFEVVPFITQQSGPSVLWCFFNGLKSDQLHRFFLLDERESAHSEAVHTALILHKTSLV